MSDSPATQHDQGNYRWVLIVLLIVLAVTLVWSTLVQRQLDQVTEQLEQQTALLERVTDQVEQQMPAGWENRLADLERQIADPARWPSNAAEAQEFYDHTSELVRELPPWAERTYLSRLNDVRWAAMAFSTLYQGDELTWQELDATVDDLGELVAVAPEGAHPELRNTLENRAQELSTKVYQLARDDAVERAEEALAGSTGAEELQASYELLRPYVDSPDSSALQPLLDQLRERILMQESEQQAAAFRNRWTALQALKADHPLLYMQAVDSLFTEVTTARVALALEGMIQPALDELFDELQATIVEWQTRVAKEEEASRAQAVREYQRWALDQIRAFERAFEDAEERASEQARIGQTWTDAEYQQVRDAMVSHLLPIKLGLLDLPVQERYQREFQRGWTRLDGREEQTFVVEQTAVTTKKPLNDFLGDQP